MDRIAIRRRGAFSRSGLAFQYAARTEPGQELRIFRVVLVLGFLFGVQVIEVADELIKTVHRRQELIAIPKVILAKLACHIAFGSQKLGNGRVFGRQPLLCAGQTDFGQPRSNRALAGDECGSTRGAGLLRVVVGKDRTLTGDPIDVGCPITFHAPVVGADVPDADVVGHDNEDIGFLDLRRSWQVGKAGNVQTVPVPDWVKRELDECPITAAIDKGSCSAESTKSEGHGDPGQR